VHPAFPAPSDFEVRETCLANLGRIAPREREGVCFISQRHCERSEAIQLSLRSKMDCFVARAPRNDDL
jgi:hypothetical protein